MRERESDAELAQANLEDKRRRAVKIGALVGLVLGILACVAVNRIYYGGTVDWSEQQLLTNIVITTVLFPVVFTLNMSYTGRPLHDAPLPVLLLLCLLLAVLEGAAIGKLISLLFRARPVRR
ncbi:MAG: hypothetical protein ACYDAR_12185 [Thermomicrobiales bacterium]